MPARSVSFRACGDVIEIEFHPAAKTAILDHHDEEELYRWLYRRHNTPLGAENKIEFDAHPTFSSHS